MSRPETSALLPPARNPCAPAAMWCDGGERAITAREKARIEEHSTSCFSIALVPAKSDDAWAHDARTYGDALNAAAWLFVEECPEKSALLFNSAKVVLRSAILRYAELVAAIAHPQPAELSEVSGDSGELAEQQAVGGYDEIADLIARLYMARDVQRAGAWSYLFAEAADALAATGKQQVVEVQGSREQFEAWATSRRYSILRHTLHPDQYMIDEVGRMWRAWQAAIASRQPVGPVPGWFELVIRDVCELEPEDPEAADTVCIRALNLRLIMERHAPPSAQGIDLGPIRVLLQSAAMFYDRGLKGRCRGRIDDALALIDGRDAGTGVGNG